MFADPEVRTILIFLVGLLLILFPLAAYRQIRNEAKSWGKLLDAARNPFKSEDEDLAELGRRVDDLQGKKEG